MFKYLKNKKGSAVECILGLTIIMMVGVSMFLFYQYIMDNLNATKDIINIEYIQSESQIENTTVNNLIVN